MRLVAQMRAAGLPEPSQMRTLGSVQMQMLVESGSGRKWTGQARTLVVRNWSWFRMRMLEEVDQTKNLAAVADRTLAVIEK
jgi:hypothetical protein